MAYDRLEPLLADRYQLALLTAVVANSVPTAKRRRAFGMSDFLIQHQAPKPPPAPEELRRRLDAAMLRLGGKRA